MDSFVLVTIGLCSACLPTVSTNAPFPPSLSFSGRSDAALTVILAHVNRLLDAE